MLDADIRPLLCARLREEHSRDVDTAIIDELGIENGRVRVDVAVVNGFLAGFEIKSSRDKLVRLPAQAEMYGRVFDFVTIVGDGDRVREFASLVPKWWGILRAEPDGVFKQLRKPRRNPGGCLLTIANLMWNDELRASLDARGEPRTWKLGRKGLVERLVAVAGNEVRSIVRATIKARGDWRAEQRQRRSDEKARLYATSSGSQKTDWDHILEISARLPS